MLAEMSQLGAGTSIFKVALSHGWQAGAGFCLGTQPGLGFSPHRTLLILFRLLHYMVNQFKSKYTKRTKVKLHYIYYASSGPLGSGVGREKLEHIT